MFSKSHNDRFIYETAVFELYMRSPAWLHSRSAVLLCCWMSTCLSVAWALWACLPACGHLFTSSSISRHGCKPPTITTSPSPAGPLHPSLVFPQDTSCEPLMLILRSTSSSLVLSTTLFPKLYFAAGTGLLPHRQWIWKMGHHFEYTHGNCLLPYRPRNVVYILG